MQSGHSKNKKELLVTTLACGFAYQTQQSKGIEDAVRNLVLESKFYVEVFSDHYSEEDSLVGLWIYNDTFPSSWSIPEIVSTVDYTERSELEEEFFDHLPYEIKDLQAASQPFERMEFEVIDYNTGWQNLVKAVNKAYENLLNDDDKRKYEQLVEQVGEPIRNWEEDE
jgi:hypothetical protein